MAKYVQPNFIVDSSAAFLRNVSFDSSVYLKGTTHINAPATVTSGTPTALVLEQNTGNDLVVKSKVLGTMAFETSTNYYGKTQVDALIADVSGALDTRLDQIDLSLNALFVENDAQDASIVALRLKDTQIDASIVRIDASLNDTIDLYEAINASLGQYVKKSGDTMTGLLNLASAGFSLDGVTITNIDTSAEGLVTTNAGIPTSGAVKKYVDAQIGAGAAYGWNGLTKTDNSIGLGGTLNTGATVLTTNGATASLRIAGLATSTLDTALALVQDSANGDLKVRALGSMAWETSTNYYGKTQVDGLISDLSTLLDTRLDNIDTSITGIWTKFGHVDSSMATMNTWNINQDISIAAISSAQGNYVLKSGDTMTGPLVISAGGLQVAGDVSIVSNGDLYVDGDAAIKGSLTINGSLYVVDVETIDVSSSYIHLNTGLTGAPPSTLQSGIIIGRGTSDPYAFVYDESQQTFRIGISKLVGSQYSDASTQAVATREDVPTSFGIPFWNGTTFRFETSAGFLFTPGTGLGLPVATNMASEATALVWDGTTVGSRELGTMAFNSSTYVLQSLFDSSITAIWTKFGNVDTSLNNLGIKNAAQDTSISNLDLLTQVHTAAINDLSTGKLDAVASTTGGAYTLYAGEANNIAYIKQLVAGSGATITQDGSTVTISVTGVAGYVKKYTGTFDGTASATLSITAATHGVGTGPVQVTVYDGTDQVYVDVDCAANGDVTLDWTPGSLGASCKYIITG